MTDLDDVTADAIRARQPARCERCGNDPDRACYMPPTRCPRPENPSAGKGETVPGTINERVGLGATESAPHLREQAGALAARPIRK